VIALCYGGGFGTMPAFATDVFGPRHAGTIYGAMLTAWSAGAIVGPLLIASVPYRTALLLIAGMVGAATVLPVLFNAFSQGSGLPDKLGPKHFGDAGNAPPAPILKANG
jgi:OFA family oxalate/formate antiporter-like MFS transporter